MNVERVGRSVTSGGRISETAELELQRGDSGTFLFYKKKDPVRR